MARGDDPAIARQRGPNHAGAVVMPSEIARDDAGAKPGELKISFLSPDELEELRRRYPAPKNPKRPISDPTRRKSREEIQLEVDALDPAERETIALEIAAEVPHRYIAEQHGISHSAVQMIATGRMHREVASVEKASAPAAARPTPPTSRAPTVESAADTRRPGKFTADQVAKARQMIRDGRPRREIADEIGASIWTLNAWAREMREQGETLQAPPTGRPRRIYTPEQEARAKELLREGGHTHREIAEEVMVHEKSVTSWASELRSAAALDAEREGDGEMGQRHSEAARAEVERLLAEGKTHKEIASFTGISMGTIAGWSAGMAPRTKEATPPAPETPKAPAELTPAPQEAERSPAELTEAVAEWIAQGKSPYAIARLERVELNDLYPITKGLGYDWRGERWMSSEDAERLDALNRAIDADLPPEEIERSMGIDPGTLFLYATARGLSWYPDKSRWDRTSDEPLKVVGLPHGIQPENSSTPDPAPNEDPEAERPSAPAGAEPERAEQEPESTATSDVPDPLGSLRELVDAFEESLRSRLDGSTDGLVVAALAERKLAIEITRLCAATRAGDIQAACNLADIIDPYAERVLLGD